ncbi:hypothetical protein HpCK89_01570 [Helicobacter pylori]
MNLGVLSALIILVIESKSPPIKGAVIKSGLIVKGVGSITKSRTIEGTCTLKIKTTAIKGGIIGSTKLLPKYLKEANTPLNQIFSSSTFFKIFATNGYNP